MKNKRVRLIYDLGVCNMRVRMRVVLQVNGLCLEDIVLLYITIFAYIYTLLLVGEKW